jgi:hypothetical protein
MQSMSASLGKTLIIAGAVIAAVGLLLYYRDSIPLLKYIGRLPGDIVFKKKNVTVYVPLATSVLVSVIVSLILMAVGRLR